jgi:hypothetical protein
MEGGVGFRAGLDAVVKSSQPLPGFQPPIIQSVAQRRTNELSRLLHRLLISSFHITDDTNVATV